MSWCSCMGACGGCDVRRVSGSASGPRSTRKLSRWARRLTAQLAKSEVSSEYSSCARAPLLTLTFPSTHLAASRARLSKRVIPSRTYVRPSIVLYEETSAAASSIGSISIADLSASPDLLIVAGTSLRIPGFKKLVKEFSKAVRANGGISVFVNREEMSSREWQEVFDYQGASCSGSALLERRADPRFGTQSSATLTTLHNA